jgi:tetratricopeptide (TPR) repeat protein
MSATSETMSTAWRYFKERRFVDVKRICAQVLQAEPHLVDAWYLQGMANFRLEMLGEAEACLRKVVAARPDIIDAHSILGMALALQGRAAEAVEPFRTAVALVPNRADAHNNLGSALRDVGLHGAAEESFREAIRLDPDHAMAMASLTQLLAGDQRLGELAQVFEEAVRHRPQSLDFRLRLSDALLRLERYDEAVICLEAAVAIAPLNHETHAGLGIALVAVEKLDEAVACFERSLDLEPNQMTTCKNLGIVLRDLGRLDEALIALDRALAIRPDYADAHFNRAMTYSRRDDEALALECMEQAIRLAPERPEHYASLGLILANLGRSEEALDCIDRTIREQPDLAIAHLNRAIVLLRLGDYTRGWAEYEWRLEGKEFSPRKLPGPRWQGEPLAGRTILLYSEQGLGDTLQFIRYAPHVKERGGRVLVECQRPLIGLAQSCAGIDLVIAKGDALPAFDVQASLLSLPHVFGTTVETIPTPIPYLSSDAASVTEWAARLAPIVGLRVGIAWQGTTKHFRDRSRSFPLCLFEKLARIEGIRLISLQKGHGVEQLRELNDRFPVIDFGESVDPGFAEMKATPAIMMSLDLVITPDTSLAHLAGALGVPVWIPISYVPDFRWLLDRDDSPWYPTVKLFRRSSTGGWEEVFERMAELLATRPLTPRLTAGHHGP